MTYTIVAASSNPSVISVNENGMVNAVSVGEATISGTLLVDDGIKEFSIEVLVTEGSDEEENINISK